MGVFGEEVDYHGKGLRGFGTLYSSGFGSLKRMYQDDQKIMG